MIRIISNVVTDQTHVVGVTLSVADEIPRSCRTLLRAQILLTLKCLEPCSPHALVYHGYRKSTVDKVLREMTQEGLVHERYRLFSLKRSGFAVIETLLNDPSVSRWAAQNSLMFSWLRMNISKPKIDRLLDNNSN